MNAPPNVAEALEKISEIHGHMTRGEIYRGYRPLTTAVTAFVGIVAAVAQPSVIDAGDMRGFIFFWVAVAAFNLSIHALIKMRRYAVEEDFARRRTVRVVGQFVPALAAGSILTGGLLVSGEGVLGFLPGVWTLLFSLALFASRPYLPRRIGWVALFYLGAGGVLLLMGQAETTHLGWGMGAAYGAGQLGATAVLFRDEERHD